MASLGIGLVIDEVGMDEGRCEMRLAAGDHAHQHVLDALPPRGHTDLAALLAGDTDAARHAFRDELELCRQLSALPIASEALLGLAAVAVVDGDLGHAARLRGAAAAHGYGQRQDDVPARLDSAFLAPARKRYGPDAWDTVVREGAQLSFDDAIAYALDPLRAPSARAASAT